MKTNIHFWSYLALFFLEWEIFQTNFVQRINIYILYSVIFFFSENRVLNETRWTNKVEPDMPRWQYNTAHALCIQGHTHTHTQQTHTQRICNTYCCFTGTVFTRRRPIVTLHLHWPPRTFYALLQNIRDCQPSQSATLRLTVSPLWSRDHRGGH